MENDSGHNGDDNNNANKTGTTKTIDGLMQATVMNNNETRQGLINLVRIFGSNCSCPWWTRADWQSLTHTDTHTHTHTITFKYYRKSKSNKSDSDSNQIEIWFSGLFRSFWLARAWLMRSIWCLKQRNKKTDTRTKFKKSVIKMYSRIKTSNRFLINRQGWGG